MLRATAMKRNNNKISVEDEQTDAIENNACGTPHEEWSEEYHKRRDQRCAVSKLSQLVYSWQEGLVKMCIVSWISTKASAHICGCISTRTLTSYRSLSYSRRIRIPAAPICICGCAISSYFHAICASLSCLWRFGLTPLTSAALPR